MANTVLGSVWTRLRRRWWVWVAAVAVLSVAGVALAVGPPGDDGSARASSTPSTTASPSASGSSPSPSATQGVEPGEPSPSPTETAPSPGSSADPDAPDSRPTAAPVPLEEPAAPRRDLQVSLARIEKVQGFATIPGEIGGPSLRITVEVVNDTDASVNLGGLVTNLYYGPARTPAISLLNPGSSAMPSTVASGRTVTGVYVFLVPLDSRDEVAVEVDLSSDTTVSLFTGSID